MLARGDGAARAAAEGGAVRQVVHLVDLVDVVRHLPRRDVAVRVGGWIKVTLESLNPTSPKAA